VATAKGADEYAKIEDVVVFRTVSGRRMAALYNLGAIRRGVYDDPRIYPNDLIVVGESQSRRMFKDILQVAPLLAGPLVLLLQN
jgi:polysaccharide export outer membrane protein